jgi:hypothetical protein
MAFSDVFVFFPKVSHRPGQRESINGLRQFQELGDWPEVYRLAEAAHKAAQEVEELQLGKG